METAMMDIMFEIPSDTDVKEVVIDESTVLRGEQPLCIYEVLKEDTDEKPETA
jgi:ATP-dependent Clp protease ATP-binding subunit ClpX